MTLYIWCPYLETSNFQGDQRMPLLSGAFCKLREEYKLKSADMCSDVRLQKPAFNLCNLILMTYGTQFPVAAFT